MAKQKFSFAGFWQGFQTIFSRNAMLIIIINILIRYGDNMKNTYRGLFAANTLGLNRTLLGSAITLFLLVGVIASPAVGAILDKLRNKLKTWLVIALIVRFVVYLSFDWIENLTGWYFVMILDGVLFCFTQTLCNAVLAISVDRRAMGSAYAVMQGIQNVAIASSSQVGVVLFNQYGVLAAAGVAGGLGLVGAVLTLFMSSEKLSEVKHEQIKARNSKFGICVAMLPLCIVAGCSVALNQFSRNFMVIYAEQFQIDYLNYMTMGYTISGILTVAVGFLCDIIDPFILILIAFVVMIPIPLGWAAGAANPLMFCLATLFIAPTGYSNNCIRILGMKATPHAQQGSFQATFMACNQIFAMIWGQLIGIGLDTAGYEGTMIGLALLGVIVLAVFVTYYIVSLRKIIKANMAISAAETPAGDTRA